MNLLVLYIYRFNTVCLELLSNSKSVSHIINIPRFLGLYGENIGPPDLGTREQGLPRTQLITYLSTSDYSLQLYFIARKEYPFHRLNNPSELQDEGTSVQFVFLVLIVKECTIRSTEHTQTAQDYSHK